MLHTRPFIEVAVVMRRERLPGAASRWQAWRRVAVSIAAKNNDFSPEFPSITLSSNT